MTTKWIKEEVYCTDQGVGIYLNHKGFNAKGEQICVLCIDHWFYSYDEIERVAEMLNDLIANPEKLKFTVVDEQ